MKNKLVLALIALVLLAPATLSAKKHPKCERPTMEVAGATFTLDTCGYEFTITEGGDDQNFVVTLLSDVPSFGFNVHGYGEGFPTYAFISNESSGASSRNQQFHIKLTNSVFKSDSGRTKVYSGNLLICVQMWDAVGHSQDQRCLALPLTVTVKPRKK